MKGQTLGSHFNMPKAIFNDTLKADLSLLKVRGILDPKQHYKKESAKSLVSEYSEVGRITEGPLGYNTRLSNKQRKRTFIEAVLADESSMGRFKNRYNEIQSSKVSGKRAYYKKLKSKRLGGSWSSWVFPYYRICNREPPLSSNHVEIQRWFLHQLRDIPPCTDWGYNNGPCPPSPRGVNSKPATTDSCGSDRGVYIHDILYQ